MDRLIIKNVNKTFHLKKDDLEVVSNLNLNLKEGEIIALLGPSGTGKSTILNMIAGLEEVSSGEIIINGKIGYMFQHDLLFDWLNIDKNLTIGIECLRKIDEKDITSKNKYLARYGLSDFKKSYPKELSGGMRQRIALIRTLLTNPDILLLDEPFSALDAQTRIKVSNDIYKMIKEKNLSAILVTHDITEALSFADRIFVLSQRPAVIKKEYKLFFNGDVLSKRENDEFQKIFKLLWNDLNE